MDANSGIASRWPRWAAARRRADAAEAAAAGRGGSRCGGARGRGRRQGRKRCGMPIGDVRRVARGGLTRAARATSARAGALRPPAIAALAAADGAPRVAVQRATILASVLKPRARSGWHASRSSSPTRRVPLRDYHPPGECRADPGEDLRGQAHQDGRVVRRAGGEESDDHLPPAQHHGRRRVSSPASAREACEGVRRLSPHERGRCDDCR